MTHGDTVSAKTTTLGLLQKRDVLRRDRHLLELDLLGQVVDVVDRPVDEQGVADDRDGDAAEEEDRDWHRDRGQGPDGAPESEREDDPAEGEIVVFERVIHIVTTRRHRITLVVSGLRVTMYKSPPGLGGDRGP